MTYETNWQRTPNSKWQSKTWTGPTAQADAKASAELWAKMEAYNANWQATRPGQDNQPAWTMRNGQAQ